jgi:hypothetical protein
MRIPLQHLTSIKKQIPIFSYLLKNIYLRVASERKPTYLCAVQQSVHLRTTLLRSVFIIFV